MAELQLKNSKKTRFVKLDIYDWNFGDEERNDLLPQSWSGWASC